ncbi:hypothetical protein BDW22DRAFT_1439673 [Trametopsis cervina]|nr:hypothetical protein BDW22DRAFT_1439673 [Trametopsis cervina]
MFAKRKAKISDTINPPESPIQNRATDETYEFAGPTPQSSPRPCKPASHQPALEFASTLDAPLRAPPQPVLTPTTSRVSIAALQSLKLPSISGTHLHIAAQDFITPRNQAAWSPPVPKVATKPKQTGRKLQNIMDQQFQTVKDLLVDSARFDRVFLAPVTLSTQRQHERAQALWHVYFTKRLGSEDAAKMTYARDSAWPQQEAVIHFFHTVFTSSDSRFDKGKGWSFTTARTFFLCVLGWAIKTWAKVDNILSTKKWEKHSLRNEDLYTFHLMVYSPAIPINSNMMHMEILLTGHTPEYGLTTHIFWEWHFVKNMRGDDSNFIQTNTHHLSQENIWKDANLKVIALGIYHNVFQEDVLALFQDHTRIPSFPYKLTLRPEAMNLPVWMSEDKTKAMSYSSVQNHMYTIGKTLGWTRFSTRAFRYSFVGDMMNKMPKEYLRHILGHSFGARKLAGTTYHAPDRPVDLAALWHGGASDISIGQFHSSIANGPGEKNHQLGLLLPQHLQADPEMPLLLEEWATAEDLVRKEYKGKTSINLPEKAEEDGVVADALSVLQRVSQRLTILQMKLKTGSLTSSSTATDYTTAINHPAAASEALAALTEPTGIQAAVKNSANPAAAALGWYLALLKVDILRKAGICLWCHEDPKSTAAQRSKNHTEHLSQHIWGCSVKHRPEETLCSLCGIWLPIPRKDVLATQSEMAPEAYFHFEQCLTALTSSKHQNETQVENSQLTLKAQFKLSPSMTSINVIFCPICLFDPNLPWMAVPKTAQRLKCTLNERGMREHIGTHWIKYGSDQGAWAYDRKFTCHWPSCQHENPTVYTLKQMLEHLHNFHKYQLLICKINHFHPPDESLTLPDQFQYDLGNESVNNVFVIDNRKLAVCKKAAKALTTQNLSASPTDSIPVAAMTPSSTSMSASASASASTSASAFASSSSLTADLMTVCLDAFSQQYPDHSCYQLRHKFLQEKITLQDILDPTNGAKSADFRTEFGLTYGEALALHSNMIANEEHLLLPAGND